MWGIKYVVPFEVTNIGSLPLQIKEVRPSCGCSNLAVGKLLLAPIY
ncbi:MAG: DUF1573 domain-containing protein [Holophagales bacterium]|nr:DUF1573 domain-containing protein [Holophagales bacterium]